MLSCIFPVEWKSSQGGEKRDEGSAGHFVCILLTGISLSMVVLPLLHIVFVSVLVFHLLFLFDLILLPLSRVDVSQTFCRLSTLPALSLSPVQFCVFVISSWGCERGGGGARPDVGVMSGGVIINIRSCRETKGLKWKGLAGRGDLAMSCTSVIFLVRLELSQGFNWNPDFKRNPRPIQRPPHPNSTPALTPLAGSTHVQSTHTQTVTTTISESITMDDPSWNWLCSYLHKMFRFSTRICVALVCVWTAQTSFSYT